MSVDGFAGYQVFRGAVEQKYIDAALRMLNLEIRRKGLSAEEIREWQTGTFFPYLRDSKEVWDCVPNCLFLNNELSKDWAEPQLFIRYPDEVAVKDWVMMSHVDTEPDWAIANDLRYKEIIGVALTDVGLRDGPLYVWPGSHRFDKLPADSIHYPKPVLMKAGDAVVMHPKLKHAGSLNLGSLPRFAIYFRSLTKA